MGNYEFGRQVAISRDLRFAQRGGGLADLRDPRPLLAIGSPEDTLCRTVDVREAAAQRSPGRFGAANLGVFVFRRQIVAVTGVDAAAVDDEDSGLFTFDPLGREVALHRPVSADLALPGPITRAALATRQPAHGSEGSGWAVDPALYGPGAPLMIWTSEGEGAAFQPVEIDRIVPANLTHWRERPTGNRVAIDPELGRIAFSERRSPDRVRVAYGYAVCGPRGAVAADPGPADFAFEKVYGVSASEGKPHRTLRAALERWRTDGSRSALIEIRDSATYEEHQLLIDLARTERQLVIRAAAGCRPVIRVADAEDGALEGWRIRGARQGAPGSAGSSVILEGLTVAHRGLVLESYAGAFTLRQCTLVPGWARGNGGHRDRDAASLSFENCAGPVVIERSITGSLHISADELITAPLPISLADTIVDAGERRAVLFGPDPSVYAELTIRRCTVIGLLTCHSLAWAENSIFSERVRVTRRQTGFVRFCYVPTGSKTPRRFACVPKTGEDQAATLAFTSRAWGTPGYAEPSPECGADILRGSDDGEVLGAGHDLYWTAREADLRAALADYLPAGVNAGIIYVD